MTAKTDITPELLRQLIDYDESAGLLYWKPRGDEYFKTPANARAWNDRYAGQLVGQSSGGNGYLKITIFGKSYFAHRIVFALHHGFFPQMIDHINRLRTDNRISNLREATYSENNCNIGLTKANKSGFKGVTWHRNTGKWKAMIGFNGKRHSLGEFAKIEDAARAYEAASKKFHKEFRAT